MIGRTMALACALALTLAAQARAETVGVDGGQLYYETCGQGPQALVLIHDGVVNSASFDDMWPILCRQFRVVRYDRRGYGKSPAAKAPYSPQDDLAAVMAPGHDDARAKATALINAYPQDLRHQMRDPIRGWPSDLPRMPELTVPTLILTGDHDIADNQAASGAAQALIPGSKRLVVEDVGHLMQLEHPREVAELIADFIRKGR